MTQPLNFPNPSTPNLLLFPTTNLDGTSSFLTIPIPLAQKMTHVISQVWKTLTSEFDTFSSGKKLLDSHHFSPLDPKSYLQSTPTHFPFVEQVVAPGDLSSDEADESYHSEEEGPYEGAAAAAAAAPPALTELDHALFTLAFEGNLTLENVQSLISQGANPHATLDGLSFLELILNPDNSDDAGIEVQLYPIVFYLLEQDVDPNLLSSEMSTALESALSNSFLDIAKLLLKNGAIPGGSFKVNSKEDPPLNVSVLEYVYEHFDDDELKQLLENAIQKKEEAIQAAQNEPAAAAANFSFDVAPIKRKKSLAEIAREHECSNELIAFFEENDYVCDTLEAFMKNSDTHRWLSDFAAEQGLTEEYNEFIELLNRIPRRS